MLAFELKDRFLEMANLLELAEENAFKIRAYRTGAEIIGGLSEEILSSASESELRKIPRIGQALAGKIVEYRDTGKIAALEKLESGFPSGLLDLLNIPGIGSKTLKILWFEYQIQSKQDLAILLKSGKLAERENFGEKTVENIKKSIELSAGQQSRIPYAEAKQIADIFVKHLQKCSQAQQIEVAGSLRRQSTTIGDIDILAVSKNPDEVINFFLTCPEITKINAKGHTKASVFVKGERQVDLRVVEPESFGSALQYFTGSKEHNILLRRIAQKKGLLLSEYGVFRGKEKVAGTTEEEVYATLDQKWIPPKERIGRDEVV